MTIISFHLVSPRPIHTDNKNNMPSGNHEPVNQVRLTNVAVVRLSRGGNRFEVAWKVRICMFLYVFS